MASFPSNGLVCEWREWINVEAFKSDLKVSDFCTTSWWNLDDTVKCYNDWPSWESRPLKTKAIDVRPRVPCFSEELKRVKSERRKHERKLLKTGKKCDRDAYRCVCNHYSDLLKKAKGLYYTDLIDQSSGDPKNLFRVINSLCKGNQTKLLPPHTSSHQLTNDFGNFFYKKIECLYRIEVSQSQLILERGGLLDIKIDSFVPMSANDVHHLIINDLFQRIIQIWAYTNVATKRVFKWNFSCYNRDDQPIFSRLPFFPRVMENSTC